MRNKQTGISDCYYGVHSGKSSASVFVNVHIYDAATVGLARRKLKAVDLIARLKVNVALGWRFTRNYSRLRIKGFSTADSVEKLSMYKTAPEGAAAGLLKLLSRFLPSAYSNQTQQA